MTRRWWPMVLALGVAPLLLCGAAAILRPLEWAPHAQADLQTLTIYAYRRWQSTGVDLELGDDVTLHAAGQWLYSPYVGLHGPEGGGRPVTVSTYPLASVEGGALLGRVGEAGQIFYVGRGQRFQVVAPGRLYLRINDDLLGDNQGELTITLRVTRATSPAPDR